MQREDKTTANKLLIFHFNSHILSRSQLFGKQCWHTAGPVHLDSAPQVLTSFSNHSLFWHHRLREHGVFYTYIFYPNRPTLAKTLQNEYIFCKAHTYHYCLLNADHMHIDQGWCIVHGVLSAYFLNLASTMHMTNQDFQVSTNYHAIQEYL